MDLYSDVCRPFCCFKLVSHECTDCFLEILIKTTLCLPLQYWVDYYLQWNLSDYPGVSNVRFPDNQIWTPDILLYNR